MRSIAESANAALSVRGPDHGARKTKVYVFPSQFVRLVSCPEIPVCAVPRLAARRALAVAHLIGKR
jgi:hypothetical protein